MSGVSFFFTVKNFLYVRRLEKAKKKKKYNEEVNQKVEKETNLQS